MSDPNSYRGGLMVTSESSPDSMLHRNRQRKQRDGLLEKQKHAHTQDGYIVCHLGSIWLQAQQSFAAECPYG